MRCIVVLVLLVLMSVARADVIGIDVECELPGRTKACPAFLLGFVDANKAFLSAPRASADVVLHVSSIEVALIDRVHLRFVAASRVVEVDADLDTRADDDAQRARLEAAFLRGIALFVPLDQLTIAIAAPKVLGPVIEPEKSPWDISLGLSGSGSWTGPYQNSSGSLSLGVTHLTERARWNVTVGASDTINRMPPLRLDDGTMISTNTNPWNASASVGGSLLFDDHWSVSAGAFAARNDPTNPTHDGVTGMAGLRWDRYKANDPRGNTLTIGYGTSYTAERYNIPDVLGELDARYAMHALSATGSIREDKTSYGLSVSVGSEILHPARRYALSASPSVTWQVGGHVDVNASLSVTKRQVPGPDPDAVDMTSYAVLSQLSYAQPFSISMSLGVTIHWDRTNGARNDR